jgi:hypothetical protein
VLARLLSHALELWDDGGGRGGRGGSGGSGRSRLARIGVSGGGAYADAISPSQFRRELVRFAEVNARGDDVSHPDRASQPLRTM